MRDVSVLSFVVAYFALGFGARSWLHRRATGSWGFRGLSGRAGSAAWWGGVLVGVAALLALLTPALAALGVSGTVGPAAAPSVTRDVLGIGAGLLGIAGTWWAQTAMGASWRVGVRESERTTLVTAGPFRWVRNPIFTFMIAASLGLALLLPGVLSIAAVVCLIAGVELQVRVVEEPYLRRTHGDTYGAYCARVGRFVPRVGRGR